MSLYTLVCLVFNGYWDIDHFGPNEVDTQDSISKLWKLISNLEVPFWAERFGH